MKVSEEKRKQKHGWLYEAEQRHQQEQEDMLALEGPKSMKPIEGSSVTTWGYKAKNAVMYVPEGNLILSTPYAGLSQVVGSPLIQCFLELLSK